MLSFKAALIILANLCCTQVQSNPGIFSTVYDYNYYDLIIGKNHIRKTSVVYALCTKENYGYEVNCLVFFDAAPFHSRTPVRKCPVNIESKPYIGVIEVLSVDLWREDKVIFVWRTTKGPRGDGLATIRTIRMASKCEISEEKFPADGRRDMIPQIFIIPYERSYDVAFLDATICPYHFCKMTVYDNGDVTRPSKAFTNVRFVHSWDAVESNSNTLLTTLGNDGEARGIVTYVLLTSRGTQTLGTSTGIHNSALSSNNGRISICDPLSCETYLPNGEQLFFKTLEMTRRPTKYAAIYSLPNKAHLAMVCDAEENSVYRVIKIGADGQQQYTFSLHDLKCEYTYQYLTAKFYKAGNTQYCLSLFHSDPARAGKIKFHSYCFNFDNNNNN